MSRRRPRFAWAALLSWGGVDRGSLAIVRQEGAWRIIQAGAKDGLSWEYQLGPAMQSPGACAAYLLDARVARVDLVKKHAGRSKVLELRRLARGSYAEISGDELVLQLVAPE